MKGGDFIIMAKVKNIQGQINELCDYIFAMWPPYNSTTEKIHKQIMDRRKDNERTRLLAKKLRTKLI